MYQTKNYTNPIKHEVPLPTEAGLFCENDKTRTMKRIAIQGIKGSYHDMAAHYFFHNEEGIIPPVEKWRGLNPHLK